MMGTQSIKGRVNDLELSHLELIINALSLLLSLPLSSSHTGDQISMFIKHFCTEEWLKCTWNLMPFITF